MGVFDDKKFEELDWISQATEPIDSVINEVLASMPEELMIDFPTYMSIIKDSYGLELDLGRVVSHLISRYSPERDLSWQQRNAIVACFELKLYGDDVVLDFEQKAIYGGEIKVVKIQATMDEKVLEDMLGKEGIEQVGNSFIPPSGLTRANEVMELLTKCEEGLRSRSERKKRLVIRKRLQELFKANEWKIKDTELANKVGFWIVEYMKYGNMAAFSNFCRLKVMTHKNQPIYSMEEVQ